MNNNYRINFFSLNNQEYYKTEKKYIKEIEEILNKDMLVILSGMKNSGKINFIKNIINTKSISNSYFYFNKDNDLEDKYNSNLELLKLLNEYIQLYKIPKIVILQNISKINGIKDFISYLYKLKYKVIIIGNDIQIGGIKEVEIIESPISNKENIDNNLKYGSINEVNITEQKKLKEKIIKLNISDIFLNSIFKFFSVKNIELYNFTITFLAENNIFLSLRELQKQLNDINNISLKTTIDYVDFSIQSKIIKKVYKYDFKNNKTINSKAKYYFTDNGIRNGLVDFRLKKEVLIENLIFNLLEYNDYEIYSGVNGKFDFSFYGKKEEKNVFIHISKENKKEELKKEINKLNKIKKEAKKYLLVEDINKFGIKKLKYDDVEIMKIYDFLEKFS